jgi:hypothetical protein
MFFRKLVDIQLARAWRRKEDVTRLITYRTPQFQESGYFYCPYVPMLKPPKPYKPFFKTFAEVCIARAGKHFDPETFSSKKGLLTRYGKKLLSEGERFYKRIRISDFA